MGIGYRWEEKKDFPLIVKEKGNNYAPNEWGRRLACFRLEMGYLSIQHAKKWKYHLRGFIILMGIGLKVN